MCPTIARSSSFGARASEREEPCLLRPVCAARDLSQSQQIATIALAVICCALCLPLHGLLVCHHSKPSIKASSPLFWSAVSLHAAVMTLFFAAILSSLAV